eukprot:643131-Rhodomonas_salina.4
MHCTSSQLPSRSAPPSCLCSDLHNHWSKGREVTDRAYIGGATDRPLQHLRARASLPGVHRTGQDPRGSRGVAGVPRPVCIELVSLISQLRHVEAWHVLWCYRVRGVEVACMEPIRRSARYSANVWYCCYYQEPESTQSRLVIHILVARLHKQVGGYACATRCLLLTWSPGTKTGTVGWPPLCPYAPPLCPTRPRCAPTHPLRHAPTRPRYALCSPATPLRPRYTPTPALVPPAMPLRPCYATSATDLARITVPERASCTRKRQTTS